MSNGKKTSNYPATMQGTDPVSAVMRNMYDAEQKRNARREGNLGAVYQAADKARDKVVDNNNGSFNGKRRIYSNDYRINLIVYFYKVIKRYD